MRWIETAGGLPKGLIKYKPTSFYWWVKLFHIVLFTQSHIAEIRFIIVVDI